MCPLGRPGALRVHDGQHALEMWGCALRTPVLVPFQPQEGFTVLASVLVELQPHKIREEPEVGTSLALASAS
jgi:hypothetical protein